VAVAVVLLLSAGIVLAPLAFGATQVWARAALEMLCAAIGLLWLAGGGRRAGMLLLALLPVLAVGLLQVIPLPASVLSVLAPLSFEARQSLGELGVAHVPSVASLDPGATIGAMRSLFLWAVVVAAVADVATRTAAARRLALALAASGGFVLVLGLVFHGHRPYTALGFHDMTGPLRPWKSPLLDPLHSAGVGYPDTVAVDGISYSSDAWVVGDVFGPYVNSNHFAGCMALTLPVALGLFWDRVRSRRWRWGVTSVSGLAVLIVVGLLAGSYAGALSLVAGALVAGMLAIRSRGGRVALGAALFTLVAAAVIAMAVAGRSASTGSERQGSWQSSARHRVDAAQAAWRMGWRSGPLGTGLGTYGEIYPAFATVPPVLYYAHNDYLQFFAETGVAGSLLALAVVGLLIAVIRRRFCQQRRHGRALHIGLVAALSAIAVHSLFDYNLHIPANAFLLAVITGLLLSPPSPEQVPAPARRKIGRWLPRIVIAVGLLYCVQAAVRESIADTQIAPLREALVMEGRGTGTGSDALRAAIPRAEQAARLDPTNARHAEVLAHAWLHLSEGRDQAALGHAREWMQRSLALRPIDGFGRLTQLQLLARATPDRLTPGAIRSAARYMPDLPAARAVLDRCRDWGRESPRDR